MKVIKRKYQDRPTKFQGMHKIGDWSFKSYDITELNNTAPLPTEWDEAYSIAEKIIYKFNNLATELKIGYIIYHKGFDSNYIVICWWSHENMLRIFSFASRKNSREFKLVKDGLYICVWDMQIHSHERNAFVKHILMDPNSADFENYLNDEYQGKI